MPRITITRTVLTLSGLAAGAVLMAAILSLVNGESGFAFTTATGRFGWLVPLVAGLVIGLVSLSLLAERGPSGSDASPVWDSGAVCDACGSPVTEAWRLCPSCGHILNRDDPAIAVRRGTGVA